MEYLEDILVPIFICVVLPVAIVALTVWPRINSSNRRAQILDKAIEKGNIDPEKLAAMLEDPKTKSTPREILNKRLLLGCIFTLIGVLLTVIGIFDGEGLSSDNFGLVLGGVSLAIGISYLIVFFVTRKQVAEYCDGKKPEE